MASLAEYGSRRRLQWRPRRDTYSSLIKTAEDPWSISTLKVTGNSWLLLLVRVRHRYTTGRDFSHRTRTRKHRTHFCMVSHETHGIIHTHSIKIIKITITNLLYLCLLVSHETRGIMHTCAIKIIKL